MQQVGVSFDLYYDARKHKIKIQYSYLLNLYKSYLVKILRPLPSTLQYHIIFDCHFCNLSLLTQRIVNMALIRGEGALNVMEQWVSFALYTPIYRIPV